MEQKQAGGAAVNFKGLSGNPTAEHSQVVSLPASWRGTREEPPSRRGKQDRGSSTQRQELGLPRLCSGAKARLSPKYKGLGRPFGLQGTLAPSQQSSLGPAAQAGKQPCPNGQGHCPSPTKTSREEALAVQSRGRWEGSGSRQLCAVQEPGARLSLES